jgi:hypothetical protein
VHRRPTVHLAAALLALGGLVALPAPAAHAAPTAPPGDSSPDGCAAVRQRAAEYVRAAATGTIACTEPRTGPRTRPARGAAGVSAAADDCGRNYWFTTRLSTCNTEDRVVNILTLPDLRIVGWLEYTATSRVSVSGRDDRWTHQFTVTVTYGSGQYAGTSIEAVAECGANCTWLSQTPVVGAIVPGVTLSGTARFSTPYGGAGAAWAANSRWSWIIKNPTTVNQQTPRVFQSPPAHRCDDALGAGTPVGCAFPTVRPILEVPRTRYPMYARHIELAINHGVPSVLTRTTSGALNAANRARACPSSYPRPAGYECDEYPFASTYNGAASQPYGRTFLIIDLNGGNGFNCRVPLPRRQAGDWQGYSVCMIPATENRDGGTDLASFYITYRVIDNDQFIVRVT